MANKKDSCRLSLTQNFSGLSELQIQEIVNDVEKVIDRSKATGQQAEVVIRKMLEEYRVKIDQAKAQRLLTIEKVEELDTFIRQDAFKDDPATAVRAILSTESGKKYVGSSNMERVKSSTKNELASMLNQSLDVIPGLRKRWFSGDEQLELDVMKVLRREDLRDVSADGLHLGNSIKKMYDREFQLKKDAGFNVQYLQGYEGPRKHPASAMRELGEEKWKALAKESFDFEAMGFTDEISITDYVNSFWRKKMEGIGKNPFDIEDDFNEIIFNSASKKMERSRKVVFKNSQSALAYDKALTQRTLAERITNGLERETGDIAAAQIFGPNSVLGFNAVLEAGRIRAVEIGGDAIENYTKKTRRIKDMFQMARGGNFVSGTNMLARWGSRARKLTDMKLLSTSILSTVTDFPMAGFVVSANTGKNLYQTQLDVITDFFKTVKNPQDARKIADILSTFAEDTAMGMQTARLGDDIGFAGKVTGAFDKTHHMFMNATGLPWQSWAMRQAIAKRASQNLADVSSVPWGNLNENLKEGLQVFGIQEGDWQHMKDLLVDLDDKTQLIHPESIFDLKAVSAKDQRRIKDALVGYFEHLGEKGSPTPNLKETALKFSVDPNTIQGQWSRFFFQYKSFALAVMDSYKEINQRGANDVRFGNYKLTAGAVTTSALFGSLALFMKDIANGRDPQKRLEDPVGFARDAFVQGGAGGIYVDVLNQDYAKPWASFTNVITGPTPSGLGNDIAELYDNLISRDVKANKKGRAFLKFAEKNSPSIPMMRSIVNKNVFEGIHKFLNTGRKKQENFYNFVD